VDRSSLLEVDVRFGQRGIAVLRQRLRAFAELEAADVSPLYEQFALGAAEDPDVAALLGHARDEAAVPALLLAAAHRLVQAEPFHELSSYYPSLGGTCGPDARSWPLFREFVLERSEKMAELIATRTVRTNEVRSAALLYPAVALAGKQVGGAIGLLEVGTCAGLRLLLDRFGYRYQTEGSGQIIVGPAKSPLGLHCVLAAAPGVQLPELSRKLRVAARVGLDRAPVDATDLEQFAWLEACVWADQPERLRLLGVAARMQTGDRPELLAGDPVDGLAAAAGRVPSGLPLVVANSDVATRLTEEQRADYVHALASLAAERPLWWVSDESYHSGLDLVLPGREDLVPRRGDSAAGVLGLVHWVDGRPRAQALARTGSHGQRLEWLPIE